MAFPEEVEALIKASLRRVWLRGTSSRYLFFCVSCPVLDEDIKFLGEEELEAGTDFASPQEDLGRTRVPAYCCPEAPVSSWFLAFDCLQQLLCDAMVASGPVLSFLPSTCITSLTINYKKKSKFM